MMQNQIGLVEFADLECRASEVPQGTLHCTGRICKTTPRHPENIVKPFHLFWGADLVAKQKDPFTCANMILFLSSKQFPLPFMGGVRTKKNWTSKLCYAQSPRYLLWERGLHLCVSVVPSWKTFGTKDLDLCRTLLESIPPDILYPELRNLNHAASR